MAGAMPGVGVVDVAPPDRSPLLGLAHQHESWATGCHGSVLERTRQVLFGLSCLEAHDGHAGPRLEGLELGDEPLVIAVQQGRRGNRSSPVEQELDQPKLVLDARDVPADADAVHRGTAKADVLVQ